MSFWKTLAGVGTGIAVVVALPVAGPVGAVTALGAAVAGTAGGVIGYAASEIEEEEQNESREAARDSGKREAKVENAKEISRLSSALEKAGQEIEKLSSKVERDQKYYNLLIAMTAVGMSCANCDGEIADVEVQEIKEFTAGIANSELPQEVKDKIANFVNNPPSIKTAFELANEVGLESYTLFDEIIEIVMHADNVVRKEEIAFKDAWNDLKRA